MPANNPRPALPQVVHEAVRREIAQMNTAICQATQNSPIKVSLTWRPNPRFAQQLSERVEACIDGDTLMSAPTALGTTNTPNIDKSLTNLEKYITGTIERLERVLALFKAAAAEIPVLGPPTAEEEAKTDVH
jgi:hypothetical protein